MLYSMALSAMKIRQNTPVSSLRGTLAVRLTCYDTGLQPEPKRTKTGELCEYTNNAECGSLCTLMTEEPCHRDPSALPLTVLQQEEHRGATRTGCLDKPRPFHY